MKPKRKEGHYVLTGPGLARELERLESRTRYYRVLQDVTQEGSQHVLCAGRIAKAVPQLQVYTEDGKPVGRYDVFLFAYDPKNPKPTPAEQVKIGVWPTLEEKVRRLLNEGVLEPYLVADQK